MARARGLETLVLERNSAGNYDEALRGLAGKPKSGVVHLSMAGFSVEAQSLFPAAQKYGLPSITHIRSIGDYGALMSYGPIFERYLPHAMVMVDRILRGERPGDLPIERPDHFELLIYLKIAKSLGLTIPHSLLVRVDEVIG